MPVHLDKLLILCPLNRVFIKTYRRLDKSGLDDEHNRLNSIRRESLTYIN